MRPASTPLPAEFTRPGIVRPSIADDQVIAVDLIDRMDFGEFLIVVSR